MQSSVRAGNILPRDTGLQWPVACWKSPSFHNTAPTTNQIQSPIPPHAFVDYALECLVADVSYVPRDHVRLQRPRTGGSNNFMHPFWDNSKQIMSIVSGNAANAYYLNRKDSIQNVALVSGSWNTRLYGAWPIVRRPGNIPEINSPRQRLLNGSPVRILRKKHTTPWERIKTNPAVFSYDTSAIGGGDEPMIIQLWGKCAIPENGYQVGDEVIFFGNDGGGAAPTNGGEVWYNRGTVGFGVAAGHSMLTADGSALVAATPANWYYQLRMAFATDKDGDILTPTNNRNLGLVSMFYTPWQQVYVNKPRKFRLPANFDCIDIGVSFRMNQDAIAGNWLAGDQLYSRNSGQLNTASIPTILVRGRDVIVPAYASSDTIVNKTTGAGGIAALSPKVEFQLRAIGT